MTAVAYMHALSAVLLRGLHRLLCQWLTRPRLPRLPVLCVPVAHRLAVVVLPRPGPASGPVQIDGP